jgi:hypothetical protein
VCIWNIRGNVSGRQSHLFRHTDILGYETFMGNKCSNILARVRVTLRLAVYRQSVHLGDKPLENHDQQFFNLTLSFIVLMSFTIAAGPRQRNHSRVRVPRDS